MLPLDLGTQRVLNLFHAQTKPTSLQTVHRHAQILHTVVLYRVHVLIAGNRLQERFNLARILIELVEFGSENLDRQIAAHTDNHFRHPHFNRLCEAVLDAGHGVEHFAHFVHQRFLALHAPLALRLQQQIRVGLIESHRVEPDFVGASTRHNAGDLRYRLHNGAVDFQIECGTLFEADRGKFLDPDNQVTLVHRRHKGFADLGINHASHHQHHHGSDCNETLPAHTPGESRLIQGKQLARQPRVFVFHFT